MSTIGIDFSRTSTVACLREGVIPACRWQLISDGNRIRIPNAVDGKGRWGSVAVAADEDDLTGGYLQLEAEPWLTGPQPRMFWERMAARFTSFLGRVEPLAKNGYGVVIAPETSTFLSTSTLLTQMCCHGAVSALDGATCIPPQRAVLSRWLAEINLRGSANVIAVTVGETIVAASAYAIEFIQGKSPHVVRCGPTSFVTGTGSAWWEQSVATRIVDLANADVHTTHTIEMRDSLLAIATRLRLSAHDSSFEWQGPFSDRMFHPIELDRSWFRNLPEVQSFLIDLPRLVSDAWNGFGNRPDAILLGGVGACWPFALEALEGTWQFHNVPVWQSTNPLEDVARGAALWPLFASWSHRTLWTDLQNKQEMHSSPQAGTSLQCSNATLPQPESLLMRWTRQPPLSPTVTEEDE